MAAGGISQVVIFGEKDFAMRVWLDPQKLALYNISPAQVSQSLVNQNVQASPEN